MGEKALEAPDSPIPQITPNDYYPHCVLREGLKWELYLDTTGNMTIGVGFNVSSGMDVLQRMGVDQSLKADIQAAKNWNAGPWDNGYFTGQAAITPFILQALYQERAAPAIAATYAAIKNPDQVGLDRMMILIDLRFNIGPSAFNKFPNVITAVNAGDFDKAAFELMGTAKYDLNTADRKYAPAATSDGIHQDDSRKVYVQTKWYSQTGNRAILNVQVMRGAAAPTAALDRATMQALAKDNLAFAGVYISSQVDHINDVQAWLQQGQNGPKPADPPPSPPPLLKQLQGQANPGHAGVGLPQPSQPPPQPAEPQPPQHQPQQPPDDPISQPSPQPGPTPPQPQPDPQPQPQPDPQPQPQPDPHPQPEPDPHPIQIP